MVMTVLMLVTDVRPPLSNVDIHVNNLNRDKNLGAFIRLMRRKFREICS